MTKTNTKKQASIIVNEIMQVSPDRNRKDIATLKSSIERAENILLPNRARLYDLYHDVVSLDGHLSGILQKRTDAVVNKNIKFIKNKKKVDELDDLIYSQKFGALITLIMESRYWGISGVEFLIGEKFDFEVIPRKHIRPENNIIVKSQYDYNGIDIDQLPFVWTLGGKYNLGLLLKCSMYAIYKRGSFGDFAQYVEIFGQPVRIIYYDAYDTRTKEQLKQILDESGSALAMMIPSQAKFEMMDGKTSNGDGDLQSKFIDICNQEMSVAILGNSETTTSSNSSGYAQAQVHGKQQLEITKSDIRFVQGALNDDKFLQILKSYGYPVDGGAFEFEMEIDLDELAKRLQIDIAVSDKVPFDDDYWYDAYGIPKPDNYDQLKAEQKEQRQAALNAITAKTDDDRDNEHDNNSARQKKKRLADRLKGFFAQASHGGASESW